MCRSGKYTVHIMEIKNDSIINSSDNTFYLSENTVKRENHEKIIIFRILFQFQNTPRDAYSLSIFPTNVPPDVGERKSKNSGTRMKRISTYLDDVSRQVENFHVSVAVTRLHRGERCTREANSN